MPQESAWLQEVSRDVGETLALTLGTHSGRAEFAYYESGSQRRWVSYAEGEVELTGEPIPQEQGFDVEEFYWDESEQLWSAFGLSDFYNGGSSMTYRVFNDPMAAARFAAWRAANPPRAIVKAPWWERTFGGR